MLNVIEQCKSIAPALLTSQGSRSSQRSSTLHPSTVPSKTQPKPNLVLLCGTATNGLFGFNDNGLGIGYRNYAYPFLLRKSLLLIHLIIPVSPMQQGQELHLSPFFPGGLGSPSNPSNSYPHFHLHSVASKYHLGCSCSFPRNRANSQMSS